MTFPGYSRQSGPDPVNAQDLATKHYVDADFGVVAVDLNTLTTGGTYIAADTNANAPPLPTGQYFMDVRHVGTVLQQRATHIALPNYIATRMYNAGAWGAWHSPSAGLVYQAVGPATAYSGAAGTVWNPSGFSVPIAAGRRYRATLWFGATNNAGAAIAFIYFTLQDNVGLTNNLPSGRISWLGAGLSAGQTWYGSGSHSCVILGANTTLTSFTVGMNASGNPIAIPLTWLEIVLEDMGI